MKDPRTLQALFGCDVWENKKSRFKLLQAAEKAKKDLSPPGVLQTQVDIENVVAERDFYFVLVCADFFECEYALF
jgi:hypothetical protein